MVVLLVAAFAVGCAGVEQDRAARAHLRRAAHLLEEKQDALAIKEIDRAIAASPRKIDTYLTAAALLLSGKRYNEAADYAQFILDSGPDSRYLGRKLTSEEELSVISLLAQARYQAGNPAGAAKAYERALRLKPDDPTVMNDLGYYYIEAGINLMRALALVKKAVDRAPENAAFVDSLGWAYYKLGRYEEAEKQLKRAVSLDPNVAEIRYHLAVVYGRWGEPVRARIELRKALELDPEFEPARVELRKLGHKDQRLHIL